MSTVLATAAAPNLLERLRTHQPRLGVPPHYLWVLVGVGLLPLALVTLRLFAMPGFGDSALAPAGEWLNRHLSLLAVSAADRTAVLHVVQLPLAALLVALTRLTLGIRVLGFRSILIAIGMREVGLLPSLLLIAIIAGAVVLVRPWMRRAGMPLYARVSTILAIVAATMVAGLLVGAATDSAVLSSMAFFPVVILAMLAESVAATVARDSTAMAAWRTASTIVLALIIAVISAWPPLCFLALACPELILTQLVLVLLISEFLDLRLLEDFAPGQRDRAAPSGGLHIAVVRNRWNHEVLSHSGAAAPKRYRQRSVQPLVNALRAAGHSVEVMEADTRLAGRLGEFFPRNSLLSPSPSALVINCAGGAQGTGRLCQVPAICEMAGVPYTGPDPLAMAAISDQLILAQQLRAAGLSTLFYRRSSEVPDGESGPWLVQHRFQSDRTPMVAANSRALRRALQRIHNDGDEPVLACVPSGRYLGVFVIAPAAQSKARPALLPTLERDGPDARYGKAAELSPSQRLAVQTAAGQTFEALRCRSLARVDLWLADDGTVGVLGLRVCEQPAPKRDLALALGLAELSFDALVQSLVATVIPPSPAGSGSGKPLSITEQQAAIE